VQGGQRCDIVSDKNQLRLDDFLGTAADAVHPAHPFQLIGGFQGFGHALGFLHLPNDKGKLLVCLFVQSVKVAAQFAGQDKLVVPDRMVFFQIFLM